MVIISFSIGIVCFVPMFTLGLMMIMTKSDRITMAFLTIAFIGVICFVITGLALIWGWA